MDAQRTAIAQKCMMAAYDGSMNFPTIVGTLLGAGFEGYTIDYRRGTATYYLPNGESAELRSPADDEPVAAVFRQDIVTDAIREAQTQAPGYTYKGFCRKVKAAGCAGYIVSFLGRRVVYFGRTAETHVELMPPG